MSMEKVKDIHSEQSKSVMGDLLFHIDFNVISPPCVARWVDSGGVHLWSQGASWHHGDAYQDDGSFPRPWNHYRRPKEESRLNVASLKDDFVQNWWRAVSHLKVCRKNWMKTEQPNADMISLCMPPKGSSEIILFPVPVLILFFSFLFIFLIRWDWGLEHVSEGWPI